MKLDNEKQREILFNIVNNPNVAISGNIEQKMHQVHQLASLLNAIQTATIVKSDGKLKEK